MSGQPGDGQVGPGHVQPDPSGRHLRPDRSTAPTAASVPATIVNWAGDEPVSAQEWCAYLGELVGIEPDIVVKEVPGGIRGIILDATKRRRDHGSLDGHVARRAAPARRVARPTSDERASASRPVALIVHRPHHLTMVDRRSATRWQQRFNRFFVWLFRRRRGRLAFRKVPSLVLHTVGRRSGRPRQTPLLYIPMGDGRLALVASNGGDDRTPAWCLNLMTNPDVEAESAANDEPSPPRSPRPPSARSSGR